ncbi:dTDP-4-dehydrorhamnose reductase [Cognatishimia maritima]|uniref:dTDP-4-dehydrorhamnose reductase n=1 Tax=Cognatishimia maritima TaxID=870908 RepID=A0A1M5WFD3_9RHOB|nr:dTDP-4-dehydrorhamnose reductase [Cognatishimia maritima]SHH85953.1 dTDP-4-dehydrorhamnose reductase [Cognatishimia maritima]
MILVFGKTGQVATELQRQAEVVALGRDQADLSDPAACAAVILERRPDAVINAAAYTAVDKAEDDEALATVINGEAPGAMAKACAELGIPFVHISTDYVFDGSGDQPWKATDPVAPINAYGRSKLAGEQAVQAAGGHYAILRTSWVFSAHGNNFVKTMLRLSETRDALSVVADQIGGPTPAADIAAACLEMARQLAAGQGASGIYHYGGAPAVSWACFARETFERAGRPVTVTDIPSADYPTPAKRPFNSRMDGTGLMQDFKIEQPDWRMGLDRVLTDLKVNSQ